MPLKLEAKPICWALSEPFTISRGTMDHIEGVLVTLKDEAGHTGRGEAYGIIYEDETPSTILSEIEAARSTIEAGISRLDLLHAMRIGGARCAVDCALWDLEAKRAGKSAFDLAGIETPRALDTAFTIGIKAPVEMARAARKYANHHVLKVKVTAEQPLEILQAVHAAAPNSRLIVDPNQSWDIGIIDRLSEELLDLNVVLLEQPLPVGEDDELRGYTSAIPICADELIHDCADLPKARGKYQVVNIKLDKSGGLTEALALARAARDEGFDLMVGCMAGSSLSMAPAMLVAQYCKYVDLDGPLLQCDDWPHPLSYEGGVVTLPERALWG